MGENFKRRFKMGKVKILAVALASLASTTFAGGDLWDFADLLSTTNCGTFCSQVHTPGATFCWGPKENGGAGQPSGTASVDKDGDPVPAYGSPCYSKTGGWWFGYADNGGAVKDASSNTNVFKPASAACDETPKDPTPTQSVGTIAIEKYINASQNVDWKTITEPAFPATGGNDKHYLVKGYGIGDATQGLDVKFINPAGTDLEPSVSAIGFNWRGKEECGGKDWENRFVEDIGSKGTGLCIVYKADKYGVDVELGWNEALYEYKTWIMKLPAATSWKTVNIPWTSFGISYEDEEESEPRETALTKAEALKFALKTKGAAETIHFTLKEVGWLGTCSGTAETLPPYDFNASPPTDPIISGKMASAYKFSINGRTLSANFAGAVQVINLQGKVVAQKTLAANESLSLAGLPAGIYMVRSENRGIVQKVILK